MAAVMRPLTKAMRTEGTTIEARMAQRVWVKGQYMGDTDWFWRGTA